MSFSDDVDAMRVANQVRAASSPDAPSSPEATSTSPVEEAFQDEVRDLWHEADQYWRANRMVDAGIAWWVEHGGLRRENLEGQAPLPFPTVFAFRPGRTRESWQSAPSASLDQLADRHPANPVPGLSVNGWFAVCAPGELRELRPDVLPPDFNLVNVDVSRIGQVLKASLERGLRWNYFQRPAVLEGTDGKSWVVEFEGPGEVANVRLSRTLDTPIEVSTEERGGWRSEGTLRELIVAALAAQMK